ncbi:MAG: hypothetical protein ACRD8Z_29265 [Nitrososphaeraceae archaeon]
MKTQQNIVMYGNSFYYDLQSEQSQEISYVPTGGAKNMIHAIPNSRSTHIYNFQMYDKAFMIAMAAIFPQK